MLALEHSGMLLAYNIMVLSYRLSDAIFEASSTQIEAGTTKRLKFKDFKRTLPLLGFSVG